MQGCLVFPQRLTLKSLAALQSCRTVGNRSAGSHSFPHCQSALELERPGISRRWTRSEVADDVPLQGTVTVKGLAFGGKTGNISMRSISFATTPSCSYKTEVTGRSFNWAIANPGKSCATLQKPSCGVSKSFPTSTTLQCRSVRTQHGVTRNPVLRVASETGGQEVQVKEEEFEFKRVVYESDSITTFYSSDISSSDSDDEVEEENERTEGEEKNASAPVAYAEGSDSRTIGDAEKGTDHKEVDSFQQTDDVNSELKGLGNYDDITITSVETVENGASEGEQETLLPTKEEKKAAQADLKLNEKLEKDTLKATKKQKKEEKKQKKVEKKLKASKKYDEENARDDDGDKKMELDFRAKGNENSSNDSVGGEEDGHNLNEKSNTETNLKMTEDFASDSENEEEDDGVTDFDAEAPEDEENVVSIKDEVPSLGSEYDPADQSEEDLGEDIDEDDFWDDEEGDVVAGDGGTGGGIVLGGLEWGKKTLELAEQVVAECGEDLAIFAFRACPDNVIRIRLDKLSDRYGSPSMADIEGFSRKLSAALEDSGETGAVPKDMVLEVSSPGAERVVRVPDDLQRFKELPMYVLYSEGETELTENDGVFELDSLDMGAGLSVWKIANVKLNREVKGRGRPLNSKEKKWRATVPFASLKQVRLYVDV